MRVVAPFVTLLLALPVASTAAETATATRSQIAAGDSITITASIVTIDPATREVTLRGPLGGLTDAVISDSVKDISRFKVGDLVSVSYFEAIAASVRRKGEKGELLTAAKVGERQYPGQPVGVAAAVTESLTVVSVDAAANTALFRDAEGTLLPTDVVQPEFQAKLKDLKPGDVVDLTYSEALVLDIVPVKPGEEAKVSMKVGTLVVDNGEVIRVVGNTLFARNDRGRVVRAVVDPSFKFQIDGKDVTVNELRPGTKLTRIALRTKEVSYSE